MPRPPRLDSTAALARQRLRADQAMSPLLDQRSRLATLSARLDRAARQALAGELAGRVRSDRRFAPILGRLMRLALNA